MVVQDAFRAAKEVDPRFKIDFDGAQDLIKLAAEEWGQMSYAERRSQLVRSQEHAREQQEKVTTALQEVDAQRATLLKKYADERAMFGAFRSTAGCKFADEAVERLQELYAGRDFGAARVKLRLDALMVTPVPDRAEVRAIRGIHIPQFDFDPHPEHVLPWLRVMCKHRQHMGGVICVVLAPDGSKRAFLFAYASQNPQKVTFSELEPMDPTPVPHVESLADLGALEPDRFRWRFSLLPGGGATSRDIVPDPGSTLHVWLHSTFGNDVSVGICVDMLE